MSLHQTPSWPCDVNHDPHPAAAACGGIERQRLYRLIRNVMGLPEAFYEAAVRPVLDAALRGQCRWDDNNWRCPVLERLSFVHRVLAIRRGRILPPGVDAEALSARAHRWTYGVFIAALFAPLLRREDSVADSAESSRDIRDGWNNVSERIPAQFLRWIEDDPQLLRELCEWVAGNPHAAGGVIAGILQKACPASRVPTFTSPVDAREPPVPPAVAPMVESPQKAEAPALAVAFMRWLDTALVEGSLRSNDTGAAVHGVEEGLLLVSPRIFRLFAAHLARTTEVEARATETTVQRALLRAGWHERAPRGVNMLRYEVTGSAQPGVFLNGVVITQPERFVSRVPAVNLSLRRERES